MTQTSSPSANTLCVSTPVTIWLRRATACRYDSAASSASMGPREGQIVVDEAAGRVEVLARPGIEERLCDGSCVRELAPRLGMTAATLVAHGRRWNVRATGMLSGSLLARGVGPAGAVVVANGPRAAQEAPREQALSAGRPIRPMSSRADGD